MRSTYLLTLNPQRKGFEEQAAWAREIQEHGEVVARWSCGHSKSIEAGDRVFLMRQGQVSPGIIGSGFVRGGVFTAPHWDGTEGKTANYVRVAFDALADPADERRAFLSRSDLRTLPFSTSQFDTRSSGAQIPNALARALEQLWAAALQGRALPEIPAEEANPTFTVGQRYRRTWLHDEYGGQRQGGISTPSAIAAVFLFTGESGAVHGYEDRYLEDGTFLYTGEGQVGDMEMNKGNLAIRDHVADGKRLLLFRDVGGGEVTYEGDAVYLGHHVEKRPDRKGNWRNAYVFELAVEDPAHRARTEGVAPAAEVPPSKLWRMGMGELRDQALTSSSKKVTSKERRSVVRLRSEAIKVYVRRRAGGTCEGCGEPAPFEDKQGRPYLEPHHVTRVADGGPDHPGHVIALCPNCHRRVHSGKDGAEYNDRLKERLLELEPPEQRGQ